MKLVIGERQSGRTTKLMHMAAESQAYIVTHTPAEAQRVFREAIKAGLNIRFPVSISELPLVGYRVPVLIDSEALLVILRRATGTEVAAIALDAAPEPQGGGR